MQWMSGSNKLSSGIKGIGDFGKKFLKSAVTGETTAKPEYSGDGILVTEQTYKHLILLDLDDWNNNLMLDDGLFLAAEKSVELTVKKEPICQVQLHHQKVFSILFCMEKDMSVLNQEFLLKN